MQLHQGLVTEAAERVLKDLKAKVLWRRSEGRLEQDGWVKSEKDEEAEAERIEDKEKRLQEEHVIWVKEVSTVMG